MSSPVISCHENFFISFTNHKYFYTINIYVGHYLAWGKWSKCGCSLLQANSTLLGSSTEKEPSELDHERVTSLRSLFFLLLPINTYQRIIEVQSKVSLVKYPDCTILDPVVSEKNRL